MHKKILSPIFFLFLIILIPTVLAEPTFTETEIAGSWNQENTYPNYFDNGTNSYGTNVLNLDYVQLNESQGLQLNFTINNLSGFREWYSASGVKRLTVAIDLTDNTTHAFNRFYIAHEQGVIVQTAEIRVGSSLIVPYTTDFFNPSLVQTANLSDLKFSLQLIRLNDTVAAIYLMNLNAPYITSTDIQYDFSSLVWNETFIVPTNFWDNANFMVYINQQGSGTANITFTGMQIDTLQPYERFDFATQRIDWFSTFIGVINFVFGLLTILYTISGIIVSIIILILPFLPYIILLYAVDVIYASVHEKSFTPITTAAYSLYAIATTTWQTIIEIASLVWNIVSSISGLLSGGLGALFLI